VWQVANQVDALPMDFHGDFRWLQLGCFGTNEMDFFVCQVDKIESSLGSRVSHC
jgi:hypothetical protein